MRASFDIMGDIAIVEIAKGLTKRERKLGQLLLDSQPQLKVVAKKVGGHKGKFRKQPLKVIAGEKRLVTTHRESGLLFTLNVSTCYFSPRMGTERLRIARQVKKGENVLVLFSGVGPFGLVIAKHAPRGPPAHVDMVELNPAAHNYAKANIEKNKLNSIVTAIKADAASFLKKTNKNNTTRAKYDRVILAWPGKARPYLAAAIQALKKGGMLHFYDFVAEDELEQLGEDVVEACLAQKPKRNCTIKNIVRCGQKEPRVVRACVDAVVR